MATPETQTGPRVQALSFPVRRTASTGEDDRRDCELRAVSRRIGSLGGVGPAFTQKTYVHASEEDLQRGQAALAKIHKIA